jgi:hypothetical protein
MEGKRARPRAATIVFIAGCLAALLLWLWALSLDAMSVSGDAVVGQAFAELLALALLWGTLLVLVVFDRALGGASWPRRAGFVLVPLAAVGAVCASDYPGDPVCRIALAGLPLLALAFLVLGRLPTPWAARAQAAALLPIAALSAYAIVRFAS